MTNETFNKLKERLEELNRESRESHYEWHILSSVYNEYLQSWVVVFNIMCSVFCTTSSNGAFQNGLKLLLDDLNVSYHSFSKRSSTHIIAE